MGDFSLELCGGTHARRTGDIGLFQIVSEAGIAAGVRRIEAVTGANALNYVDETESLVAEIASLLKGSRGNVLDKVKQLSERTRQLEKELSRVNSQLASAQSGDLLSQVQQVNGIAVLATHLEGTDPKSLRDLMDQLKNKLGSGVVVLLAHEDGKVSVVAGVTKDLTSRIKAGDLVRELATILGGKGGGRPDMAQGGGTDATAIPAALQRVPELVSAI